MLFRWLRSVLFSEPTVLRLSDLKEDQQGRNIPYTERHWLSGKRTLFYEMKMVVKIAIEFLRAFGVFRHVGPSVTVFGSARFSPEHPHYQLARRVGKVIAEQGFTVITGGGPGVMEAANRGAKEGGGQSYACNILLPFEQQANPYLDRNVTVYYFFVRKVVLVKFSCAFVIMPGGFGTLDEFTEAMTLMQTGKIYDFPMILVGREYWKGFVAWARESLLTSGAINEEDLRLFHIVDSPEELEELLRGLKERLVCVSS